jgi:hypothetical protein
MKQITISLLVIAMVCTKSNAQISNFKVYNIPNIGSITIPKDLDTLGQNIFKTFRIEQAKEYLDSIQEKSSYQNRLAQLIESRFDTTVTLFLPIKAIFDIVESVDTVLLSDSNEFADTAWFPMIFIQKKIFKYHSSEMKKLLTKPSDREKFTSRIAKAYVDVMKNLMPQLIVKDTATTFFWYKSNFPVLKLSVTYNITGQSQRTYVLNVFSIYKANFNYFIRFEFLQTQEKEWKSFEKLFFDKLQLL